MSIFRTVVTPLNAFDPCQFAADLRALGATVPDELNKIIAVADAAGRVDPDRGLLKSLEDDAAAGRLTPDEMHDRIIEAAQSLVLKTGAPHPIGRVREALANPLRRRALVAVAAHAAEIERSLSDPLARAVEHFEAAAQVLGDSPPDPGRTPQGGPVVKEAVQRWQQGNDMLTAIRRIRRELVEKCRYGSFPVGPTRWCELTTAADYDRFRSATQDMSQLWRAVPAGYRLTIVSPERAAELDAQIAEERAEAERQRHKKDVERHNKRVARELAMWRSVGVELAPHEA